MDDRAGKPSESSRSEISLLEKHDCVLVPSRAIEMAQWCLWALPDRLDSCLGKVVWEGDKSMPSGDPESKYGLDH